MVTVIVSVLFSKTQSFLATSDLYKFIRAAKLDHLSKLKVGWQKLKVDLESCWKVVSTEFESELADSDSVW